MTSDARLTGCYVVKPTGGTAGAPWGRLTVRIHTCDASGRLGRDGPVTWLGDSVRHRRTASRLGV